MIIYGAILIPILTAIVLYLFFKHRTSWWEFLVPAAASILLIIGMKAAIEAVQVRSDEYWGSFVQRAEYYEAWDEWIEQTCTRSCCCDSKGENCGTETYDCSYRLYHPPSWHIVTTTGEVINITSGQYKEIVSILGGDTFVDMHRDYYTIDGDKYFCAWSNSDSSKAIPVTTLHSYENRVKAADQSVFHFEKVSDELISKYKLFQYPPISDSYKQAAVLGDNSQDGQVANKKLQYINGKLGHSKQVKVFVLVFCDQPVQAGIYQKWLWSGGNMNEFVVCIGVDKLRNVKWCEPISWTRNEELKVRVKQFVQNQEKLNLCALSDFMQPHIKNGFQRLDFKEFDYLTVEPPAGAVVFTYILTLLINIGLSMWIIKNEHV